MEMKDYIKLATDFANQKGCDIVRYAGEEDGWHYFSFTRLGLPRYGSLPQALRIDHQGNIEELGGFVMRSKVSDNATKLAKSSEVKS